ncbi:MAG: hypothetical protein ACRC46_10130 [Thermoguttaceae bacterium]
MSSDSSAVVEASIGVVVATSSEAGGLVDAMRERSMVQSGRVVFHCGKLAVTEEESKRCVVAVGGVGAAAAVEATQLLVETFRPQCVIVAGFAGGLRTIDAGVYSINRVVDGRDEASSETASVIELVSANTTLPQATLLTVSRVVKTPQEKASLAERYAADLVDMETFAVAAWCRDRCVPLIAVRILFDTAGEEISDETVNLMNASQKSTARLVGSLARILFTKPTAFSSLYAMKERAIVASDALARAVAEVATARNV